MLEIIDQIVEITDKHGTTRPLEKLRKCTLPKCTLPHRGKLDFEAFALVRTDIGKEHEVIPQSLLHFTTLDSVLDLDFASNIDFSLDGPAISSFGFHVLVHTQADLSG